MRISDNEHSLIAAAQRGDQEAFGGLVRAYQQRAYIVARAILTVHEDAEDAVQDAFLKAYEALDRFDLSQPFGAWLNRIVANAARDLARRRKVRDAEELAETLSLPFHDPAQDGELKQRLAIGLANLPERIRSVVVLHDVQGFTHAEIGEMLGIPEGTARSDLHHARRKLRQALENLKD